MSTQFKSPTAAVAGSSSVGGHPARPSTLRIMPAAKEVSRCTPVKVEGSFVFEILGYSHHRGMGVGRFIGSDRFSLGGYDWEIRLYPDGQHTRDYIAIYLEP
ncbi:hypothetical protein ZWY2020_050237 [Hordeum vulgare]|nr:hypothetical protein ZWY2020_050237 [Hordeum vulgare]